VIITVQQRGGAKLDHQLLVDTFVFCVCTASSEMHKNIKKVIINITSVIEKKSWAYCIPDKGVFVLRVKKDLRLSEKLICVIHEAGHFIQYVEGRLVWAGSKKSKLLFEGKDTKDQSVMDRCEKEATDFEKLMFDKFLKSKGLTRSDVCVNSNKYIPKARV